MVYSNDGQIVPIAQLSGSLGFGLVNRETGEYVDILDPAFRKTASMIEIEITHSNGNPKRLETEHCTAESFGGAAGFEDYQNMVCIKDMDQLEMLVGKSNIQVLMRDCDSTTVATCEGQSDRFRLFDEHLLVIIASHNIIDYENFHTQKPLI